MGNSDGIFKCLSSIGTNQVLEIDGGHFSFAFGNEIALVINSKYYIYNCNKKLWNKVKEMVNNNPNLDSIKQWWYSIRNDYEINDWSNDFDDIR